MDKSDNRCEKCCWLLEYAKPCPCGDKGTDCGYFKCNNENCDRFNKLIWLDLLDG